MVLRIFKLIAAGGLLTALECTKFVFDRGSAQDPTGELITALLKKLAGLRGPIYMWEKGGREEIKGEMKEEERNGREPSPLRKLLDPPLLVVVMLLTANITDCLYSVLYRMW